MAASEDSLALLRSIDASLKTLVGLSQQRIAKGGASGPAVASESECRSKYGDPTVKGKDPRDWSGQPMKGRRYSECPPDYLDLLAQRHDYFATVAEKENKTTSAGKPVAQYELADARRARGWAALIRAGKHAPAPVEATTDPGWAVTDDGPEIEY